MTISAQNHTSVPFIPLVLDILMVMWLLPLLQ